MFDDTIEICQRLGYSVNKDELGYWQLHCPGSEVPYTLPAEWSEREVWRWAMEERQCNFFVNLHDAWRLYFTDVCIDTPWSYSVSGSELLPAQKVAQAIAEAWLQAAREVE